VTDKPTVQLTVTYRTKGGGEGHLEMSAPDDRDHDPAADPDPDDPEMWEWTFPPVTFPERAVVTAADFSRRGRVRYRWRLADGPFYVPRASPDGNQYTMRTAHSGKGGIRFDAGAPVQWSVKDHAYGDGSGRFQTLTFHRLLPTGEPVPGSCGLHVTDNDDTGDIEIYAL
jgi:hypothetical protein